MIISMPFLLLTFLVYAVLPDRNLHGKCLMCYVITLFGAYAFLVFIQLYPNDLAGANCKTLGILCFFFFTVSFFWMNVMSIDIWWAFSGLRGFSGSRKEAERKRFILYCGYAWGVSLLLTTIVIGFTVSENVEKNVWYNPGMGDGQCWFRDGVPTLLYFYVPMATIIVVNITLFAVTACKIKRVQQDTAMLRKDESKKHSYENDKQRFNLYLKLMLAMGVNWAMEIVSWIVDWQIGRVPPPVWYLTDFCNALYGVFVFFIFVFKRNIWKLLKRRYYMIMGKPHLARSMTQTAYSPRTTGSSLNHTVSTDKNFVTDSSVLTSEVS
uniref:G-protein coupled receptors family 2 profile 2 domain-containing protein n=3 Tax=Photinus pyralis TaxID=7054 RepID=A0A1Y1NFN1_PHOPY